MIIPSWGETVALIVLIAVLGWIGIEAGICFINWLMEHLRWV